ncbi:MAG: hypothetical protein HRJ53_04905 [Acidobacteria bacterium Pan2503]|uniref:Uncharacterized protein n=1 Tax=Candidatus Acidiferrum panamense TaxID=2741543 RepID=A0A7V8SVX3_9BACT|nr:hypothetical protein [Candidatus Acidoferrum panamensis]
MTDKTPVTPAGPTSAPTPPTWPQPCGTCKFYDTITSWCRFNAPIAFLGAAGTTTLAGASQQPVWVTVDPKEDWCGQYIAKG